MPLIGGGGRPGPQPALQLLKKPNENVDGELENHGSQEQRPKSDIELLSLRRPLVGLMDVAEVAALEGLILAGTSVLGGGRALGHGRKAVVRETLPL